MNYQTPLESEVADMEEQTHKTISLHLKGLEDCNNKLTYWEKRCLAVEMFVNESPGDPDIYVQQIEAYQKWQEIKRLGEPTT